MSKKKTKNEQKLIARTEVQNLLGIDINTMKRLEKDGYFTPIKLRPQLHYSKVFYKTTEFEKYFNLITEPNNVQR